MTSVEIHAYEKRYAARRRESGGWAPDVKRGPLPSSRATGGGEVPLHLSWEEYLRLLRKRRAKTHDFDTHPDGQSYVDVVTDLHRVFIRRRKFSRMNEDERRDVAGLRADRTAYFGTTYASGVFSHRVLETPEAFDPALDAIPSGGPVTRTQFDVFAKRIRIHPKLGRPGLGSRLLAMKRPDIFLCMNKPNRKGLAESFGFTQTELRTYDGYWALHEILRRTPWFKTHRPRGIEGKIWDARVALVDAIFYSD